METYFWHRELTAKAPYPGLRTYSHSLTSGVAHGPSKQWTIDSKPQCIYFNSKKIMVYNKYVTCQRPLTHSTMSVNRKCPFTTGFRFLDSIHELLLIYRSDCTKLHSCICDFAPWAELGSWGHTPFLNIHCSNFRVPLTLSWI